MHLVTLSTLSFTISAVVSTGSMIRSRPIRLIPVTRIRISRGKRPGILLVLNEMKEVPSHGGGCSPSPVLPEIIESQLLGHRSPDEVLREEQTSRHLTNLSASSISAFIHGFASSVQPGNRQLNQNTAPVSKGPLIPILSFPPSTRPTSSLAVGRT